MLDVTLDAAVQDAQLRQGAQHTLRRADTDGDGKVSLAELRRYKPFRHGEDIEARGQVAAFQQSDLDGDGALCVHELPGFLRRTVPAASLLEGEDEEEDVAMTRLQDAHLVDLAHRADADGDGYVSLAELTDLTVLHEARASRVAELERNQERIRESRETITKT